MKSNFLLERIAAAAGAIALVVPVAASAGGAGQERPGAGYPAPDARPDIRDADPAPRASGPRGSSQRAPGEQRYDEVGIAGVRAVDPGDGADSAVVAVHRSLPADTAVEVTALDSGRTILVLVTGAMEAGADHPIDLSASAARQLGHGGAGRFPVRIRTVVATPQELAALHAGRAAPARMDAPELLLKALRRQLATGSASPLPVAEPVSATPPSSAPPVRAAARPAAMVSGPAPKPLPKPVPGPVVQPAPLPKPAARPAPAAPKPAAPAGRWLVQVAALSNAGNAQALAHRLHGFVKQGGGLHRVQLGPFATQHEADAARAKAVRAGYADARVLAVN